MPLGYLSDVSRKPLKCPLGEIRKQQNGQFTTDEDCHVAVNMRGFKVSKEVYLPYSAGETIRNRHAISTEKQVKIMYRQAVSNSFLRPYILTTLHYYIITFSFSTSPFRPFALSQSSKQHPQKTKQGLTQKMISVRRAHQEKGLRSFFKELNPVCAANKKPPRCLFF